METVASGVKVRKKIKTCTVTIVLELFSDHLIAQPSLNMESPLFLQAVFILVSLTSTAPNGGRLRTPVTCARVW